MLTWKERVSEIRKYILKIKEIISSTLPFRYLMQQVFCVCAHVSLLCSKAYLGVSQQKSSWRCFGNGNCLLKVRKIVNTGRQSNFCNQKEISFT